MTKILIIDSDSSSTALAQEALEHKDYIMLSSETGEGGQKLFHQENPGIVLLAAKLPDVNALVLLKTIKDTSSKTEVIMILEPDHLDLALDALDLGALCYLIRPQCFHELDKVVMKAIKRRGVQKVLHSQVTHLEQSLDAKSKEITTQGAVEEELRKFSAAVEQCMSSIVITNTSGSIEYVNPQFEKASGYSFKEVEGKNSRILKSGETPQEQYTYLWETISSGKSWHGEFHNRKKSGEFFWELASVSPIQDKNGIITHFVAVKEDITERKLADKELRFRVDSEKLLASISKDFFQKSAINGLNDLINKTLHDVGVFFKVDRTYLFFFNEDNTSVTNTHEWCGSAISPRIDNLQNLPVDSFPWLFKMIRNQEIVKMERIEDLPEEAAAEKMEFIKESIQSLLCIPIIVGEVVIGFLGCDAVLKTRTWRKLTIRILEITGEIIGNAKERLDTENMAKIQNQQLIQADKMASIGTLAAGVAHEINNPLNVAIGDIFLFRRDFDDMLSFILKLNKIPYTPEIRKQIEDLKDDVQLGDIIGSAGDKLTRCADAMERISTIVKRLRVFSHVDTGEVTEIYINEAIESTLNIVPKNYKQEIEIIKEFGDLPAVPLRGGEINQVFMNLIVNACQAMEHKGRLTIITTVEKHYLKITICDSGPGIPPDKLTQIFNPFYTTKDVGEGTGLGLSISFSIIEGHGGRLEVCNNPDMGVTFTIQLPVNGIPD